MTVRLIYKLNPFVEDDAGTLLQRSLTSSVADAAAVPPWREASPGPLRRAARPLPRRLQARALAAQDRGRPRSRGAQALRLAVSLPSRAEAGVEAAGPRQDPVKRATGSSRTRASRRPPTIPKLLLTLRRTGATAPSVWCRTRRRRSASASRTIPSATRCRPDARARRAPISGRSIASPRSSPSARSADSAGAARAPARARRSRRPAGGSRGRGPGALGNRAPACRFSSPRSSTRRTRTRTRTAS